MSEDQWRGANIGLAPGWDVLERVLPRRREGKAAVTDAMSEATSEREPGFYWVHFDDAREPEPARWNEQYRGWERVGLQGITRNPAAIGPRIEPPEHEHGP